MSLELRLVAYQPDGPRLGLLPDHTGFAVTDTANGISSLELSYPLSGIHAEWLLSPCEVAVEYSNGSGWVENRNARFMVIQEDGNFVADDQVYRFQCPGYAWQLQRAQIVVPAELRTRTGKRTFRDVTPGRLISAVVGEAQGRGTLPGLVLGFTATETCVGTAWLNQAVGLEFEPLSDVLQALTALADQGVVDWYMQGRTLMMGNSSSDIAFQRFGRMPVTFDTEVSVVGFAATLGAENTSRDTIFGKPAAAMTAAVPVQPVVVKAGSASKAFASRQHPSADWLAGQDWATGTDSSRSPAKRVALIKHRAPTLDDPSNLYMGAMMVDWTAPVGQLLAVSEYDDALRDLATGVFLDTAGTAVIVNDSTAAVAAERDIRSGYMRRCITLTDSKVSCIELGVFASQSDLPVDVVLQPGAAENNPFALELRDRLLAQGLTVRFDYGTSALRLTTYDDTAPPAPTGPQIRVLPRKDSYYEVSVAWDGTFWGGVTPADLSHVEVHRSSSGADFTPNESTIQPGNLTKAGVRLIELRKNSAQWWKFVAVDQNGNKSRPSGCGIVSRGDLPGDTNMQSASKLPPHPGGVPTVVRNPLPADLVQSKMILAERMGRQSGRYVRAKVSSAARANVSKMTKIRAAMTATITYFRPGQPKIQWGAPKETLPNDGPLSSVAVVGPVDLLAARDLIEAPHSHTLAGLTSRVYAYGEAYLQTIIENTDDRIAPWGEWETGLAQGGVFDEKDLQILGFKALADGSGAKETYTRGLAFDAAKWLPFRDYDAGDIILSPDRLGVLSPMRVAAMTVTLTQDGVYTGSVSISERIVPIEVRNAKQIKAIAGGSVGGVTTGGSGTRPVTPSGTDQRKPRPTFLN